MVLFSTWIVSPRLVIVSPLLAFVVLSLSLLSICFSTLPWPREGIDWVQSLLFLSAPLAPSILPQLLVVPRVFVYLLHVLKFLIW